jgi:hypothetical protein
VESVAVNTVPATIVTIFSAVPREYLSRPIQRPILGKLPIM